MECNNPSEICPMCSSDLRFFFINFKEKILMCGNTNCEYPFCNEDIPIVETDEMLSDDESNSGIVKASNRNSDISEETSSQERNINDVDIYLKSSKVNSQDMKKTKKKKNNIEAKLTETNKLFKLLYEESLSSTSINNSKWIQNLKQMQETSHERLLSNEEMGFVEAQATADVPAPPQITINLELDGNVKCIQLVPMAPSDNT